MRRMRRGFLRHTEKRTKARLNTLAARKSTTKKTARSAQRSKQSARRAPEPEPVLSRAAWGAVWAVLGLLFLLAMLPIDGVVLVWLHRGIGALIGLGSYVLPFALLALAGLLFAREKGPVRLRGACIAMLPVLIGSIIHAFTCANEYDFSMRTLTGLLRTGMEGDSGGLLSGGLYIVLEWALSSVGALLVLLILAIAALLGACRITPQALLEMLRPPEYEYEDEEERERYEAPPKLPNVHEVAAVHAQKREERRAARRKTDIDIPLDSEPPGEDKPGADPDAPPRRRTGGKPIAPDEYLRSLNEETTGEQVSILDLVENKQEEEAPAAPAESKPQKTEKISADEQAALNDEMDENQKAPMPVYDYPPIELLAQGKRTSVAGAEAELRENSECLIDTLQSFNIEAQIIGIVRGP